jgi:biotin synthase-like enzyme
MYLAGCNGTMIGNYLTTAGRSPEEDIQEIIDLGLTPRKDGRWKQKTAKAAPARSGDDQEGK